MILKQPGAWGNITGRISTTPEQALSLFGFHQNPDAPGVVLRKYRYMDDNNNEKTGYFISNYYPPSNPKTTLQQRGRKKFATISRIAKAHKETLIKPIWTPLGEPIKQTGYNAFRSQNLYRTGKNADYSLLLLSDGDLEPTPKITNYTITGAGRLLTVFFDTWAGPRGKPTDIANCCFFVKSTLQLHKLTPFIEYHRSDGQIQGQMEAEHRETNIIVYIFFAR